MGLSVGDLVVSVEAAACGVGSGANIVLYISWMQSFAMEMRIDSVPFGKAKRRKRETSIPDAKITNSTCHPSLGVA
jgi:hypothetical protein